MEPTEHDPIARRLHSLGDQPIDPQVVASHRSLMASVPVVPSRSRLRPLMVGSLLAGSLLGGVGLAAAGPGVVANSASDVAKAVVAAVSGDNETKGAVESPAAKVAAQQAKVARTEAREAERETKKADNGAENDHGVTRSYTDCPLPGDKTGTHGQYVSSVSTVPGNDVNERQVAAQSDCGKPVESVNPATPGANDNKPADPGKSNLPHGREDTGKPERTEGSAPGKSGAHRADTGRPAGVTPGS